MSMDRAKRRHLELRAEVIKAMAHATRLYLVEQLTDGEHCVCDLTDGVGADTSTVSRHLAILKHAGIDAVSAGKRLHHALQRQGVLQIVADAAIGRRRLEQQVIGVV